MRDRWLTPPANLWPQNVFAKKRRVA